MRRSSKISPNEIVIEVATKQNSNLLFHPLGSMTLRGRWDPSNVRLDWDDDSPYRGLPLVPGIYICLDMKARTLRCVDPLDFEQNEGLLETVKACAKHAQGEVGPWPETKMENSRRPCGRCMRWSMASTPSWCKASSPSGKPSLRCQGNCCFGRVATCDATTLRIRWKSRCLRMRRKRSWRSWERCLLRQASNTRATTCENQSTSPSTVAAAWLWCVAGARRGVITRQASDARALSNQADDPDNESGRMP
jgi:hypothetical protein